MNEPAGSFITIKESDEGLVTDEVETRASSEIPLEIEKGDLGSSAGPSGCGKSTFNDDAVIGLLSVLHRERVTICVVTQDPHHACHSDRTTKLFGGRIVEDERAEKEVAQ